VVNVTVTDPDGDPITSLTATNRPAGATFSPGPGNTTGTLNWTPSFGQAGTYTVTFTATNAFSVASSIEITIGDVDRAPLISAVASAFTVAGVHLAVVATVKDPTSRRDAHGHEPAPRRDVSHTSNNRSGRID
jgi:hypothetical protein